MRRSTAADTEEDIDQTVKVLCGSLDAMIVEGTLNNLNG